jgi:hypothetical protein
MRSGTFTTGSASGVSHTAVGCWLRYCAASRSGVPTGV